MAAAPNQDDIGRHGQQAAVLQPPFVPTQYIAGQFDRLQALIDMPLNNVLQEDVDPAAVDMLALLHRLQGPNGNAILEAFRQHSRFNVTIVDAVVYIWRLEGHNRATINTVDLGQHITAIFDLMFHRDNNPLGNLQAMVFVRAIIATPNRFQALPQDIDGVPTPFSMILMKLLDHFYPLGPRHMVPIDGQQVTLDEAALFFSLKDIIIDVVCKLPFNGRFWLNTRGEGDAILMRKYREFGDNARDRNIPAVDADRWDDAIDAISDIHVAAKARK